MKAFIFVRHGQSQANADGIVASPESPLTQEGIDQARETARQMSGRKITVILSSPYLRAQQTAEIIAGELGIAADQVQYQHDLRERGYGKLENQPKLHDSEWYFTTDTGSGVEPKQALFDRMQGCLAPIRELARTENVLVVGHAVSGFYLTQIAHGKGSTDEFDRATQMNNADFLLVS